MTECFHYLDNASTVFPKPQAVLDTMMEFYSNYGVNPGRGAFAKAKYASEYLYETRKLLCTFFGGDTPERLIFTANSTESINITLFGILETNDHVLATELEHNSTIRPLNVLERDRKIELEYLPCNEKGVVSPETFEAAIKDNTRMFVVNHGSNVFGTVHDLEKISAISKKHNILLVVDVSQTAGVLPIDVKKMNIDALCFTGHKSMLGPTGTGGVYFHNKLNVRPFKVGGSGIAGKDRFHPKEYPYHLEAGTPNTIGIAGLRAGIEWVQQQGIDKIHDHEMKLYKILLKGVSVIDGVKVYFPDSPRHILPVLSLTFTSTDSRDAGKIFDQKFGIATRCGCHCAPLAHKRIGTYPIGTVRISIGPFTTEENINATINAVKFIAAEN